MRKIFREPLSQFLILGALLFLAHSFWESAVLRKDMTINVSAQEIERQALIFASENQRPPTDEDIKASIIRRRLAQKMRFIIEDIEEQKTPSRAVLEKTYQDNIERFSLAEMRSFSHIYISPDRKNEALSDYVEEIKGQLKGQGQPRSQQEDWHALGDPFMLQRGYKNLSRNGVRRLFGTEFAQALFETDTDSWQGPIDSAFGRHFVYIDRVSPGKTPAFDDVCRGFGGVSFPARVIGFFLIMLPLIMGLGFKANAHEVRPAFLKLYAAENAQGVPIFSALWKQPVIEGKRLKITPKFPDDCILTLSAP